MRPDSSFRDHVTADGSSGYPAEAGRYHLYVSLACPWAHRTIIVRRLKRLEDAISLSIVDPIRDERGWAFTGAPGTDRDDVNGFRFLAEAYRASDPGYDGLNNAVYRAGFGRTQEAYDHAVHDVFATLDWLEERLTGQRYLVGETATEADWRLFTTLVRFDPVYVTHFRCDRRRIIDYVALSGYLRDLYTTPGVADTVDFDQIRRHYFLTHRELNPRGILPIGPELDLEAPHGRASLP